MRGLIRLIKSMLDWVEIIVFAVVFAILINLFVIQPIKVEGKSMDPTIKDGDFVIISRISKLLGLEIDYGDIVVIDSRTERKRTFIDDLKEIRLFNRVEDGNLWIKRIIGKPGDIIEIKDGLVYRNNEDMQEPYINEPMGTTSHELYKVPEGYIFVMGDNRNYSMDSRIIGYVPIENIKGKMILDVSKILR